MAKALVRLKLLIEHIFLLVQTEKVQFLQILPPNDTCSALGRSFENRRWFLFGFRKESVVS